MSASDQVPQLHIDSLDGDDRLRAERLLADICARMIAAVEALPDDDIAEAVPAVTDMIAAIGISAAREHGELGKMAFRDALALLGYFTCRHQARRGVLPTSTIVDVQ